LGLSLGLGAGLAPGPLLALVVRATLRHGFAAGARLAAAPLISDAPIVVVCVLVLRELSGEVLAALSAAGAVFVAWLAWEALHGRSDEAAPGDLRRAVVVNALSPHPWLFWATVGGPLVVEAAAGGAAAFIVGFYATLVGTKVAIAALVEAGRRRGSGRVLPRAVAERVGASGTIERFGAANVVSAVLLGAAAVALLADAISRL
jgi:threonine/homoserine/homoserine lactone efflux protein